MARQLKVVSPEGILHFVLDETTAKGNFCRAHGLRTAYFNLYVISKGTETNGWQLLENIKYLQHVASGAIVVVVGKPKQFLNVWRTRMAAAPVDVMPSGAEDAATAAAIAAPGEPVAEDDSEPAAEDDSDEEDAASSSEEEDDDDEPAAPHRKFFCCERDEKPGGYWWCASCSKCFHHACKAHAVKENGEPIDGNNKVCKQCHAHIMAPSARALRKRSRDGA